MQRGRDRNSRSDGELTWLIGMGEGIEAFVWRCRTAGRSIHARAVQHVLALVLGALASFNRHERWHGEGR